MFLFLSLLFVVGMAYLALFIAEKRKHRSFSSLQDGDDFFCVPFVSSFFLLYKYIYMDENIYIYIHQDKQSERFFALDESRKLDSVMTMINVVRFFSCAWREECKYSCMIFLLTFSHSKKKVCPTCGGCANFDRINDYSSISPSSDIPRHFFEKLSKIELIILPFRLRYSHLDEGRRSISCFDVIASII